MKVLRSCSRYWWIVVLILFVSAVFDQSYIGRRDVVVQARRACNGAISDRQDTIRVRTAQAIADSIVGSDRSQPFRTRQTRLKEANAEWASVTHLKKRTPPAYNCESSHPMPSPWPHF